MLEETLDCADTTDVLRTKKRFLSPPLSSARNYGELPSISEVHHGYVVASSPRHGTARLWRARPPAARADARLIVVARET
ncbi:hypothetical protein [Demequina aurantiaca]|uniref:hypothetical protein n=1 Tax=Demequina aurantiaca TaxID=676200 RepID=UPI003D356505